MILNQKLDKYKLILASKSPRRQMLLSELGLDFEVRLKGEFDESYPQYLGHEDIPVFLAQKKAQQYIATLKPDEILITSDTIVWCEEQVLGKPEDRTDAINILRMLSGNKHIVITGVAISTIDKSRSFSVHTDVFFRHLTDEEIEYYVDKFKPYDKAGAYGVQEWIGYVGVERIDGSYFNVMGLPVQKLYTELLSFVNEIENQINSNQ